MCRPFVKWAGGKGQIVNEILDRCAFFFEKDVDKYCEPFVGGGAILFSILSRYNLKEILINDINCDLIDAYNHIKYDLEILLNVLIDIEKDFLCLDNPGRKEYYYNKRDRFNLLKLLNNGTIEKSALFLFLNKTCFNGLYRVNKKGEYNVPIGSYKNPVICDIENLRNVSKTLETVRITCGDYEESVSFIDSTTFVYIDPPYRPLSATSSFNSYNEVDFDDSEQIRLGRFIEQISFAGAKIIASNSDPKNTDDTDNFFDDMYSNFTIERIKAKRMINSNGDNRGFINELLISNIEEEINEENRFL